MYGDTIENYQFIRIDGRWKLLATSNELDRPFLFDLAGNPAQPAGWLHWSKGRELVVPQEAWNTGSGVTGSTFEHANCAYLVDTRSRDGHFYLLYEDTPEKTSFRGEGHGVLANRAKHRSRALVRPVTNLHDSLHASLHWKAVKAPERESGAVEGCVMQLDQHTSDGYRPDEAR